MTEHEPIQCSRCYTEIPNDADRFSINNELLCEECYDGQTTNCDNCGTRIWCEDNCGDSSITLCEHCYENHYITCERCGRPVHRDNSYCDDDSDYCESCYDQYCGERSIKSYDYKPYPIFYGEGTRYLGVELEMDGGGEIDNYAEDLMNIANRDDEHSYCKHDGSLNDGIEFVTHPMTLDYHMSTMPWESVLRKAISLGYRSHQANTCGLHVHVNRSSFGNTTEHQDTAIARVLFFIENHWDEFLRFSRRTQHQLQQWAARYGRKNSPKELLDSAKDSYARYACVNLTNHETIEFRLFRGTLKLNTLIATLQLVDTLCEMAVTMSDLELEEMSWVGFVESLNPDEYPELITYLKERRLYINEPVFVEAEV